MCDGSMLNETADQRARPGDLASASPAAPLDGIRQHEQVQARQQEQEEWDERQETDPGSILVQYHGDEVDDEARRKSNGQPAVALPNKHVPVQGDLL